jgi:hypothetical protein
MEQKPNILIDKTFTFSKKIIQSNIELTQEKTYEIWSQLPRSGTSIAKLCSSAKEARETHYWLKLINETNISKIDVEHLL